MFMKRKKSGSLFSIEIQDKEGGEIKCTFFNDVAEKFYSLVKVGHVYEFSNGWIKVANKRYQRCKNDLCVVFNYRTEVIEVKDKGTISKPSLNITPLSEIPSLTPNDLIDI